MIKDTPNKDLTNKILHNLHSAVGDTIKNASILLRCGNFTGSGVIFCKIPEKKKFYVLTAKHNLLIAAKQARQWEVLGGLRG